MIECLTKRTNEEFSKGIENIDSTEMQIAADIIDKLCNAEYHAKVSKAMENPITAEFYNPDDDPARLTMDILGSKKMKDPKWANYGMHRRNHIDYPIDYDDGYEVSNYGVRHRMGNVNYAYHNDHMMDDGMKTRGYSDGYQAGVRDSQPDYREGRSGNKRMTYMVSKEIHDSNTADDIAKNNKLLDEYLDTLWTDMEEMTQKMSPTEKATLKNKMNTMLTKIV